ncbi:Uv-b-induced protein [Thalictrum thalictroides]|uniref:Uv-b-induced protein n=1 Tax=Thalictrum thalictroides TaxID=46969 RepID=A0A7J6X1Y7_THATH|nr:Uv-b-induced protein [Thalictrum thalictroides]
MQGSIKWSSPWATSCEESDFFDRMFKLMGGGAVIGIWLSGTGGRVGDCNIGCADAVVFFELSGAAGGFGLAGLTGVIGLGGEHLGEENVVLCVCSTGASTPFMPWHLIEDPAMQMFGLMIWTLLSDISDSIRSLGIRKVTFPGILSALADARKVVTRISTATLVWACIPSSATTRGELLSCFARFCGEVTCYVGSLEDSLLWSPSCVYNKKKVSTLPTSNFKSCQSFYIPKLGIKLEKTRGRGLMVRASGNPNDNIMPIAPLQFESPSGQLLAQILQTHPHLLPSAIDQQLENLQTERDSKKEEAPQSSQDLLQRRIAEVREKEKQKALEEIIYCLIVQKFMDNDISMIPPLSVPSDPTGRVDYWPNQEQKLESVHSVEAFEMIQNHLSLVLGERLVGPLDTLVHISKLKLGKLYAASIMYGYFLRRVDERFQLERTMKTLPEGFNEDQVIYNDPTPKNQLWDAESLIRVPPDVFGDGDQGLSDSRDANKSYRLRSYVMYLDAETLQKYATIRSKESISLIEKQTQALFGRPDIRIAEDGSLDMSNDEAVGISFSGLTMLVMEAVAFGSFLWDAEGYVESKYHFFKS